MFATTEVSESTACSARRIKISDNINDLNNEIKGAAKSVIEDLKELLRKDVDRGGFKDFQGKLTYITYVPFVFKQDEEGLAGVVKENEGPGSSFIAKARAQEISRVKTIVILILLMQSVRMGVQDLTLLE